MLNVDQSAHPIVKREYRGTGTSDFSPTRQIMCVEEGVYLVKCSGDSTAKKAYLIPGLVYPYHAVNVLSESGTALSTGEEIVLEY